jgi:ribosomal-protein-serine acetyltransferase
MDIAFPQERFEGSRIVLRRYELADAEAMFAAIEADRPRLRTFLPWVDLIRVPADEETYIRSAALQWMEGRLFDFGIFARDTGAYLGNIGVHTISWIDERAELGYWLSSAGEGKGLMTEAVALIEAELFRLNFHRIEIRCNDANARSAAVPRRAGYVHEGTLREDVIEHGQRRNTMVWGKLCK